MCPLCIGTAAWLVSGGTSAGGITALVLKRRLRAKRRGLISKIAGARDPATVNYK